MIPRDPDDAVDDAVADDAVDDVVAGDPVDDGAEPMARSTTARDEGPVGPARWPAAAPRSVPDSVGGHSRHHPARAGGCSAGAGRTGPPNRRPRSAPGLWPTWSRSGRRQERAAREVDAR